MYINQQDAQISVIKPEQHTYDVNPLFQLILNVCDTSLTDRNKKNQ